MNKRIKDMADVIDATAMLLSSEDLREGAMAFLKKRAPVWKEASLENRIVGRKEKKP
ncbi:MAG: hypothetical protein JSV75_02155 [Candidatus Bathyarchaeota archaeon]|nr:MAG: hypothetical protein JSV75_02155 [Candidatus Bathyarchaeota archaeon]